MDIVESNAGKMEVHLGQWGMKLDKLMAQAEAAGTEVEIDYRRRFDDLNTKYQFARSELEQSKAAGSAKWGASRPTWKPTGMTSSAPSKSWARARSRPTMPNRPRPHFGRKPSRSVAP
jgi:hypothetical protein